jgi:hypothetical protein
MLWYWRGGSAYYRPEPLDAARAEQIEREYGSQDPAVYAGSAGDTIATDF